ncbi:ecdysone-induced protein 78C-like isoform X1 [Stegodyphus dumicola]|uniref:ecdysone-induced protein 78C-like isoform X1 n=1 Tax=Stegodyphus dumicola TaxID=202533 RepID=UPI0015AFAD25|nr:ecdysone-induced protein 78C-like isoform X1 [Stegodyphus dumicola]XP_035213303.1 ecdysone-induced protein 78C-like isoform X1 [Stegodyphus dumicola]XP_035213304.1 ecdysone-induced protein 78C-like isoform X1 [Stegodyphus dumicola]XP_035213305.1 ecdysone-induced protein 78C-like isoform X1 [Stegodyphus dumicola]
MEHIIQLIVEAHEAHCPYIKSKIQDLVRTPLLHSLKNCEIVSAKDLEKTVLWSHLAAHLAPSIKPLIYFASHIPDFCNLNLHDRIMCIRYGLFEIWLVHVSRLANPAEGTITFCSGSYISRRQLEAIYEQEFVAKLFNFLECLNDFQLNDTVIALYSAVVLHTSERHGIHEPVLLKKRQAKYIKILKYQMIVHDRQPEVFEILISMLPELHNLGQKHDEYLKRIWSNSSRNDIPLLLAEVFDFLSDDQDFSNYLGN